MKAYSHDLRKRIVQAVETSPTHNQSQVARTFQVSRSTVRRLLKLEAKDPDLKARTSPGRRTKIAAQDYAAITTLLEAQNDLTLQDLCQHWSQHHGQSLSLATMSRLLKRLGWTRKKRLWQPPSVMKHNAPSSSPTRPV